MDVHEFGLVILDKTRCHEIRLQLPPRHWGGAHPQLVHHLWRDPNQGKTG